MREEMPMEANVKNGCGTTAWAPGLIVAFCMIFIAAPADAKGCRKDRDCDGLRSVPLHG